MKEQIDKAFQILKNNKKTLEDVRRAREIFTNIPSHQNNFDCSKGIMRCYSENNLTNEEYQAGIEYFNSLPQNIKKIEMIRASLARCYLNLKQWNESINTYTQILSDLQNDKHRQKYISLSSIYVDLASVYTHQEQYERAQGITKERKFKLSSTAIKFLEKSYSLNPNDITRKTLAFLYEEIEDYTSAKKYYSEIEIKKLNGDDKDKFIECYGRLLEKKKDYREAIEIYRKADNPYSKKFTVIGIAKCHIELKEASIALEVLRPFNENCNYDRDQEITITIIKAYIATGNIAEAEKIADKREPTWRKNKHLNICFAFAHQAKKDDIKAREYLDNIPSEMVDDKVEIARAINAQHLGNHEGAIDILNNLSASEYGYEVLLGKALAYRKVEDHKNAVEVFSQIEKHLPDNEKILYARSCYALGENVKANKLVSEITKESIKNNRLVRLSYAHWCLDNYRVEDAEKCMTYDSKNHSDAKALVVLIKSAEIKEKYGDAIAYYKELQLLEGKNSRNMQGIIYNYIALHQYFAAECLLKDYIKNNEQDIKLYDLLGRIYQKCGRYQDAIDLYEGLLKTSTNDDKEIAMLGLGYVKCYQQKYDEANAYFNMVLEGKNSSVAYRGKAFCLIKQQDYQRAIDVIKQFNGWNNDTKCILMIAECEMKLHKYQLAKESVNQIREKNHIPSQVLLLQIYEASECYHALYQACKKGKNKFKYCYQFHLWEAFYYQRKGMYEKSNHILESLRIKFPNNTFIIIESIRSLLTLRQANKAAEISLWVKSNFSENHLLLSKIDSLFQLGFLANLVSRENQVMETQLVEIPSCLDNIFIHLNDIQETNTDFLAVGGTVIDLLTAANKKTFVPFDIDIVTNHEFTTEQCRNYRLYASPHVKGLYQLYNGDKVDIMLTRVPAKKSHSWHTLDAFERDFTICSVFLKRVEQNKGLFMDPTGLGINDAQKKILRTVISPRISMRDPVRLLRAIKYIRRGYQPVPELEIVLKNWASTEKSKPWDNEHFIAVAKQLLMDDRYSTEYARLLQEYQLLPALFNLNNSRESIQPKEILQHLELLRSQPKVGKPIISLSNKRSNMNTNKRKHDAEEGQVQRKIQALGAPVPICPDIKKESQQFYSYSDLNDYKNTECEYISFDNYRYFLDLTRLMKGNHNVDEYALKANTLIKVQPEQKYRVITKLGIPYNPYTLNQTCNGISVDELDVQWMTVEEMVKRFGASSIQQKYCDSRINIDKENMDIDKDSKYSYDIDGYMIDCCFFPQKYHSYLKDHNDLHIKDKVTEYKDYNEFKRTVTAYNAILDKKNVQAFISAAKTLDIDKEFTIYQQSGIPFNPFTIKGYIEKKFIKRSLRHLAHKNGCDHFIEALDVLQMKDYEKNKLSENREDNLTIESASYNNFTEITEDNNLVVEEDLVLVNGSYNYLLENGTADYSNRCDKNRFNQIKPYRNFEHYLTIKTIVGTFENKNVEEFLGLAKSLDFEQSIYPVYRSGRLVNVYANSHPDEESADLSIKEIANIYNCESYIKKAYRLSKPQNNSQSDVKENTSMLSEMGRVYNAEENEHQNEICDILGKTGKTYLNKFRSFETDEHVKQNIENKIFDNAVESNDKPCVNPLQIGTSSLKQEDVSKIKSSSLLWFTRKDATEVAKYHYQENQYEDAIECCIAYLENNDNLSNEEKDEVKNIMAHSYLATNRKSSARLVFQQMTDWKKDKYVLQKIYESYDNAILASKWLDGIKEIDQDLILFIKEMAQMTTSKSASKPKPT